MMYLKNITLSQFRCYDYETFEFGKHKNILVGKNAIGKTSLVEAVGYLCLVKSFKNAKDMDLVNSQKAQFHIRGTFVSDENVNKISVIYENNNKRIIKNEKHVKNLSEYVGLFNIVWFSPDDLDIVKGSPNVRRRFIDTHLGQMDKTYLLALSKYKKILKERNEYLKSLEHKPMDPVYLQVLTQALIGEAKTLITKRETFFNTLSSITTVLSNRISSGAEQVQIVYKPHTIVDNLEKIAINRESFDLLSQTTTWGPMRDDFIVLINGKEANLYASQGQIRSVCLSLKLGLVKMMEDSHKEIMIILDDVFSELDASRQNEILHLITNEHQTFITTTSIETLSSMAKSDSTIIYVGKEPHHE